MLAGGGVPWGCAGQGRTRDSCRFGVARWSFDARTFHRGLRPRNGVDREWRPTAQRSDLQGHLPGDLRNAGERHERSRPRSRLSCRAREVETRSPGGSLCRAKPAGPLGSGHGRKAQRVLRKDEGRQIHIERLGQITRMLLVHCTEEEADRRKCAERMSGLSCQDERGCSLQDTVSRRREGPKRQRQRHLQTRRHEVADEGSGEDRGRAAVGRVFPGDRDTRRPLSPRVRRSDRSVADGVLSGLHVTFGRKQRRKPLSKARRRFADFSPSLVTVSGQVQVHPMCLPTRPSRRVSIADPALASAEENWSSWEVDQSRSVCGPYGLARRRGDPTAARR